MGYIYVLENKINKKCYVGQTRKRVMKRIKRHINNRINYPIGNALNKHGIDNFRIHIFCIPNWLLNEYEVDLIAKLKTQKPNGYNIEAGGKYQPLSQHSINKIKETKAINKSSRGIKNPMYGKHHTEETKKKISVANKGKIRTEEFRNRMSILNSGKNNSFYGKKHTEEIIEKLRNINTGKKRSLESRFRQSKTTKGRKQTPEHIKNRSRSKMKKVICVDTGIIYNSLIEASAKTNISNSHLSQCCNGIKNKAKDLIFKYIEV